MLNEITNSSQTDVTYSYNNIVLSMLYVEICPKVRRHNALPIMPSYLGTYIGILHGQHNSIAIITLNVFGDFEK